MNWTRNMNIKLSFYDIASLTKIGLGLAIMIIIYTQINVYEDPIIGLLFGFLWVFIFAWWVSFFVFYFFQKLFKSDIGKTRLLKDSYKLSLLFGIYAIINLLLISMEQWTKLLGLVVLVIFILLQIILLRDDKQEWWN